MRKSPEELCNLISYQFTNPALLEKALTHRSAAKKNNERMEFLGDSVLGLVISSFLFKTQRRATEGELSRWRSSLVKGDKLADLAQKMDLGDYLKLGSGEMKSGGHRRASILADTMEAIFAAVLLDSDYQSCEKVILHIYKDELENLPSASSMKDAKTRLQEYMQSRQLPLPEYSVIEVTGEAHKQSFTVDCKISLLDEHVQATASSRRKAEQKAAAKILKLLNND